MNFNRTLLCAMAVLASQLVNDVSAQQKLSSDWSVEITPRPAQELAQADRQPNHRLPNHLQNPRPVETENDFQNGQPNGPRFHGDLNRGDFNRSDRDRDDSNREDMNRGDFNRGPQFQNPPRAFDRRPANGFNGPQFIPRQPREDQQRDIAQRENTRAEQAAADATPTNDSPNKKKGKAQRAKKRQAEADAKKADPQPEIKSEKVEVDPKDQLPVIVPQAVRVPSYVDVYNTIPFSRATHNADPTYRHNATMELLLGQLRPQTIYNAPAPAPAPGSAGGSYPRPVNYPGYGMQGGYNSNGRVGFNYFVFPGAPTAPTTPALQGRIGFGTP